MLRKSIVIDLEWDIYTHKPFLLGYAYNLSNYGYLSHNKINARNIKKILKGVDKIFVFGPDAGIIENNFLPNLKTKYKVYNVLTAVRALLPHYKRHGLDHLERYFLKINRKYDLKDQRENLFELYKQNPKLVINYNYEDVLNTIRLINELNRRFQFDWESFRL